MTRKHFFLCLLFISFFYVKCKNNTTLKTNDKKTVTTANVNKTNDKKSVQSLLIDKSYDSLIRTDNAIAFLTKYGKNNKEFKVKIATSFGDIYLELFKNTPIHRASFIYLVKKGYFDETLFYRISKNFVIQGGNTNDKSAIKKRRKIGGFFLPQEKSSHKHLIGSLAAAKEYVDNPYDYSNPYNFYIIVDNITTFNLI